MFSLRWMNISDVPHFMRDMNGATHKMSKRECAEILSDTYYASANNCFVPNPVHSPIIPIQDIDMYSSKFVRQVCEAGVTFAKYDISIVRDGIMRNYIKYLLIHVLGCDRACEGTYDIWLNDRLLNSDQINGNIDIQRIVKMCLGSSYDMRKLALIVSHSEQVIYVNSLKYNSTSTWLMDQLSAKQYRDVYELLYQIRWVSNIVVRFRYTHMASVTNMEVDLIGDDGIVR